MKKTDILRRVDHTVLKAVATWDEVKTLCDEALQHQTASVCIPPDYVSRVHSSFPTLNICTVIGFPLGYSTTATKVFEATEAIASGATEVDMVINLGDVKDGRYDKVTAEIAALRKAAGNNILKVIIETCYLTDEEKIKLCKCVTDAKADYIKTSTGFGTAGAQLADIELFKAHIGAGVKIKASGGIRTSEDIESFCNAGCDRIGCSAAIQALCGDKQLV